MQLGGAADGNSAPVRVEVEHVADTGAIAR